MFGPIKVPLLVDEGLFIGTELSGAGKGAHGAEVLVESIFDCIGRRGWRLLLGWSESIS